MKNLPAADHWRDYFSNTVLQRGRQYFQKGKVKGLTVTEHGCSANVLGTRIYRVEIEDLDDARPFMMCSCPHAAGGARCKHMAAVLFAWENEKGTADAEETGPAVFPANEPAHQFLRMSSMTVDLVIPAVIASRAEKLLSANMVEPAGEPQVFYTNGAGEQSLRGRAGYAVKRKYDRRDLQIEFRENYIEYINCNACGYLYIHNPGYAARPVCDHAAAGLMLLDQYFRKYNPGDASDYAGLRLMGEARKEMAALRGQGDEDAVKEGRIRLVPRIVKDYNDLWLTFRIGTDKLYMAKNMQDIVDAEQHAGEYALGKNASLNFGTETFSREAARYYEIIERQVGQAKADRERLERSWRRQEMPEEVKSRIPLAGTTLDDFFEIAVGQTVEAKTKNGEDIGSSLKIADISVRVTLVIRKQKDRDGQFRGIELSCVRPFLIRGSRFRYMLKDGILGRISRDNEQKLRFLYVDGDTGTYKGRIGVKHLSEFYYRILPVLMENPYLTIVEEDAEEIEKYLPPRPEFRFYFDVQDGAVVCRLAVRYGESEVETGDGSQYHPAFPRDLQSEQEAIDALRQYLPRYDAEEDLFWEDLDDDVLYDLLEHGISDLMNYGEVHVSDAFARLRIRKTPVVSVGVGVDSDLLNLEVKTEDMSPDELLDLLDSYRRKKRYHRLRSGEFLSLEENESLSMLSQMMDSMGVSVQDFTKGKMHLPLYRALYLEKMMEEHEEVAARRDRTFRALIRNFNAVKESDFEVPESLRMVLRKYQAYGYKWLRTLAECGFGGILADDMGLGKTLQMIAVILSESETGDGSQSHLPHSYPSLIVCPASLVYNWEEEFHRFAPSLNVRTVTGTVPERKNLLRDISGIDALITSYDLLKRDIDLYEGLHFRFQVLDEAQYIKNQKAAVAKTVKLIHADRRFALTGTPIENRLAELWSIFDFLMPGFLFRYEQFRTRFETPITKNKDENAAQELRKMVSPFILRREKRDVLKDLPEKMEEIRYARFETPQQKLYDAQVTHMKEMLAGTNFRRGEDKIRILAELTKIRQICCDPSLLMEDYREESAKREACLELIRNAIDGGHKMLVFSQFTSMLALLEEDLKEEKIGYYKIIGDTPKEERLHLVHAFNEDDTPVFLISLKAGGTGLNLTGADIVIHYDPWWNVAAQNQATDRAHRIGQTKQVTVFKLIVKDTIEEKILQMQEAKRDLADAILSGEGTSLTQLSQEELMELLQ